MSIPEKRPRPGELYLKQWIVEEAQRLRVSEGTVFKRYKRGDYPNITVRKVNSNVVFISTPQATARPPQSCGQSHPPK